MALIGVLTFLALLGMSQAIPLVDIELHTNTVKLRVAVPESSIRDASLSFDGPVSRAYANASVDTTSLPEGKYTITGEVVVDGPALTAGRDFDAPLPPRTSSRIISATLDSNGVWLAEAEAEFKPAAYTEKDIQSRVKRDNVINDDLIVDGSACIGFDCTNGEDFSFDTIRLKENNLRIKFLDTSSAASFPSNDWQITANEHTNGGLNKFSIDDITSGRTPFTIEAAAPAHSLYVADNGNVGLGTSNPVVELHQVDGDTPSLRLEQDGSSGFTPQTWDIAGNEVSFFIRDATSGSTLPFRIRPGSPSNSLNIQGSGGHARVGVGRNSPEKALHIKSTEDPLKMIAMEEQASTAYFGVTPEGGFHLPHGSFLSMSANGANVKNNRWRIVPSVTGLAYEQYRDFCGGEWIPVHLICRSTGIFTFDGNQCVRDGNTLDDRC